MVETIHVGGVTYTMPYADVLRPLTDAEYARLRESIAEIGVEDAVLVDEQNNMLDGHNRLRIAADLGKDVRVEVRAGLSEDEKLVRARELNEARRHLTPKEQQERAAARRERVMKARQEGKSQVQIAVEERVSQQQISQDVARCDTYGGLKVAGEPPRIKRRDGTTQRVPRHGMQERARALIEAHPDWSNKQVGDALDMRDTNVARVRRAMEQDAAQRRPAPEPQECLPGQKEQTQTERWRRARRPDIREMVLALLRQHPDWTYERVGKVAQVSPSLVGDVARAERRRHEEEAARSGGQDTLTPEIRAKIMQAGGQRKWDHAMVEQALANMADPQVPAWRKEDLLAGRSEPLVYTPDRRLVPMRASLMEPANARYAPIAEAMERVRSAMHALESYDPLVVQSVLSVEARRDWEDYRSTVLRRHLDFVSAVLHSQPEDKRAGGE